MLNSRSAFERICCWLAIVCLVLSHDGTATAAENNQTEVTAAKVEEAIKRACTYLIDRQSASGRYPGYNEKGTGQTSLVTLALLNAGLPLETPAIERSLQYIRSAPLRAVYSVSLDLMVLCNAQPARDLPLINRRVQWLLEAQRFPPNESAGGWGYDQEGGDADESNSQFAVLALWEAERVGVKIPVENLRAIARYWIVAQEQSARNGVRNAGAIGWGYRQGQMTGSMTCAGIAAMLMTEEVAMVADVQVKRGELQCCGNDDGRLRNAAQGMQWLSKNFSIKSNPGTNAYSIYYLYALERVGRLTGKRIIAGHDWYREGCAFLLSRQGRLSGPINDNSGDTVSSTAMAVLFLSKGKRQIVVARARLDEDNVAALNEQYTFKHHDHAITHLTGHIEQAWKRDLAWQSLDLADASVTDLLESPVLFISGTEAFELRDNTKAVLKQYIEQGGFIFAEARNGNGCDASAFETSFTQFVADVFNVPLRKLDATHPVWNAQVPIDVTKLPKDFWLYGAESCCRTAIVYSPISLACRWEVDRPYGIPADVPRKISEELTESTAIGLNVITYATGRELKDRLKPAEVSLDRSDKIDIVRGTLRVPRLRHAGGDDDTPRAVPRMLSAFEASIPTLIDTQSPLLTPTSSDLEQVTIAYISGRNAFRYSDADRTALREYFANGGFLIGDAVCASESFLTSLKAEMAAILPDARWEAVAPNDPILSKQFGGFDIRNVTLLDPAGGGGPIGMTEREGPPVLERLIYRDRTVFLFSIYDLSCALESSGANQCRGYTRQDAAKIGINMILYASLGL